MNPALKMDVVIAPTSTTNGATTTGYIDTLGHDFIVLAVHTSTSNNVTNNPSVLKIAESADTVVSNATNISGCVGDTDFTIPNSVTSGEWIQMFRIDTRARKRYLHVSVSPVTTQTITCMAALGKSAEAFTVAAGNVKGIVSV